ncbi:MAG: hypothetical protein KDH88_09835 [Chromatiales bacterium]|nr:hypothetical protein [Chromatiales bacterium]
MQLVLPELLRQLPSVQQAEADEIDHDQSAGSWSVHNPDQATNFSSLLP